jgi:hypothetical protein
MAYARATEREVQRFIIDQFGVDETIRTDLSSVLLAPGTAIKLRRRRQNGFIDYRRTDVRAEHVRREWRRGIRHSAALYRSLLEIRQRRHGLSIGEQGELCDLGIVMRRFNRTDRLDAYLQRGPDPVHVSAQLGQVVAEFHDAAQRSVPFGAFATPEIVRDVFGRNVEIVTSLLCSEPSLARRVARLERAGLACLDAVRASIAARSVSGVIRVCHGDLHPGNIAVLQGDVVMFDFLDGPDVLVNLDPISDLSMLFMGVWRWSSVGARTLVESYFDQRPDPAGTGLLPFYSIHRALVRTRVELRQLLDQPVRGKVGPAIEPMLDAADEALRFLQ